VSGRCRIRSKRLRRGFRYDECVVCLSTSMYFHALVPCCAVSVLGDRVEYLPVFLHPSRRLSSSHQRSSNHHPIHPKQSKLKEISNLPIHPLRSPCLVGSVYLDSRCMACSSAQRPQTPFLKKPALASQSIYIPPKSINSNRKEKGNPLVSPVCSIHLKSAQNEKGGSGEEEVKGEGEVEGKIKGEVEEKSEKCDTQRLRDGYCRSTP
jgi:hypothetical protein